MPVRRFHSIEEMPSPPPLPPLAHLVHACHFDRLSAQPEPCRSLR